MDSMIRQFYEIPGKVVALKSGEYLFHEGDHAFYHQICGKRARFVVAACDTRQYHRRIAALRGKSRLYLQRDCSKRFGGLCD